MSFMVDNGETAIGRFARMTPSLRNQGLWQFYMHQMMLKLKQLQPNLKYVAGTMGDGQFDMPPSSKLLMVQVYVPEVYLLHISTEFYNQ